MAQQLASRLNMPNVLQTDIICEVGLVQLLMRLWMHARAKASLDYPLCTRLCPAGIWASLCCRASHSCTPSGKDSCQLALPAVVDLHCLTPPAQCTTACRPYNSCCTQA